jgi:hypothetical protein
MLGTTTLPRSVPANLAGERLQVDAVADVVGGVDVVVAVVEGEGGAKKETEPNATGQGRRVLPKGSAGTLRHRQRSSPRWIRTRWAEVRSGSTRAIQKEEPRIRPRRLKPMPMLRGQEEGGSDCRHTGTCSFPIV